MRASVNGQLGGNEVGMRGRQRGGATGSRNREHRVEGRVRVEPMGSQAMLRGYEVENDPWRTGKRETEDGDREKKSSGASARGMSDEKCRPQESKRGRPGMRGSRKKVNSATRGSGGSGVKEMGNTNRLRNESNQDTVLIVLSKKAVLVFQTAGRTPAQMERANTIQEERSAGSSLSL